ncbi:MAG: phosphoribosylformylglycinamidine synthase II [Bacteroidetes bacterium MED-G20]|nr:MAG: phosphoribosylformylglycinamidine synthase II [Bacteroidetes bacterium MED-G20]|tara:strand:+ start:113 stop:2344 length:2232 start_codon:yes stop_codon:yes gene_type:complete
MSKNISPKTSNIEQAIELGLKKEEFHQICDVLGRTPNFTELSIYSVMWSEHCSYKNSIHWLKKLPKDGPHMLVKAGEENAGLVDIGDGLACAFKIESHNHPSALEPYQGAATGVGGINRDIFTMGARPIAQMNSLRFGEFDKPRTKWLLKGVVKGIGNYGNSFGIPVLSGEVFFDESYDQNPLVNAFSAGIMSVDDLISATASGPGNPVFIVGSSTGKDGIHGAAFASKDITEDSMDDLPAVQVGDPFQEKLLLEASLELAKTDAVVGMQDMGAAGITCSTSEMSAAGNVGMKIDLDKVPTRQSNMKDWEILLSESQERMLVVVEKGKEYVVKEIFDKWDLNCELIGEVTHGDTLEFFQNGLCVASVPPSSLVLGGGAPVYERKYTEPAYFKKYKEFKIDKISVPTNLVKVGHFLFSQPNIASKKWVYEQYDTMVGTNNVSTNHPSDAGVALVKGTMKAIAMSVDCNSRYVHADPEVGTAIAVSEAARNIVVSGGNPSAITNCLNFGNPYHPESYWQFVGAIKGMSKACEKFSTPVTGGNVSFYNQSIVAGKEVPVFPTPTIGMIGLLNDVREIMSLNFKAAKDHIFLIGKIVNDISSSEYLVKYHNIKESPAPYFDIDEEYELHQCIKNLISKKMINAAHDCADGGLFVSIVEMAMNSNLGCEINFKSDIRKDAFLFGESQGRVVVTVSNDQLKLFNSEIKASNIDYFFLGEVSKEANIKIDSINFGMVEDFRKISNNVINL